MSHARTRKYQRPEKMEHTFEFTERELWRIQKGMLVSARAIAYHRWGPSGYRQYGQDSETLRYNQRVSRNAIRAIRIGIPNEAFLESSLARVYEASYAAYSNALHLKRDEQTARNSAVVNAQIALEFITGVFDREEMGGNNLCENCGGPA